MENMLCTNVVFFILLRIICFDLLKTETYNYAVTFLQFLPTLLTLFPSYPKQNMVSCFSCYIISPKSPFLLMFYWPEAEKFVDISKMSLGEWLLASSGCWTGA